MKINKGLIVLFVSFIAAGLIVAVSAAVIVESVPAGYHGGLSENLQDDSAAAKSPDQTVYFVREYNGVVGVFIENGSLAEIINVPTVTLPITERQRLAAGFTVNSAEELSSLKENYTG